jgi:predicted TIM-barrel fold metal-dependent hydrolase
MPPYGLDYALHKLPVERFMFGSDAGFGDPYWQAFQLEKLRSLNLSEADMALILGGNAQRVLG